MAGGGLHAQLVDLVEAAAVRREAHDDVDSLVVIGRAILGHLRAVGDELHPGADDVDVGVVFRRLALVHLDAPVDAGQRQAVIDVTHVRAGRKDRRGLLGGGRKQVGIERRELDLHRLAGRRSRAGRRHFDQNTGDVGGLRTNAIHDLVAGLARAPVGELELDDADRVFGELVRLPRLLADAGIDGLQTGILEHTLLDGAQEAIFLVEREVAAAMDDDLAIVRFDLRKELDAVTKLAVRHLHADQQHEREQQRRARMPQREPHRAHVGAAIGRALVVRDHGGAAEQRTERRREEQRDHQRSRERRDQSDREILHEFADDTRPEQQRRERRNSGECRCGHRPGHALGGQRISFARRHALGHAALGEFRHDDRVIDQHADRKDEREQHHDVDGQPGKLEPEHARKERCGNRDAYE